jgi:two-component system, OmpR family, phosphate regulon sensor histidine kinase PhoR
MSELSLELLEFIEVPALLVVKGSIEYANPAALELLGNHIRGEDVRIAIRNPAAVGLLATETSGRIRVDGLSIAASKWELCCNRLPGGELFVTLNDLSIQASVSRSHADFVANASHELRTPLASILGYVETLTDMKPDEDLETRERFLGIIKREAMRMQALVEDLMSLSRIEALKHDAPQERLDLVALTRQTLGEFHDRPELEFESNSPTAMVAGDGGQLSQVLRNLVDNALKYGSPGGPVKVSIETAASGWVNISVRDSGEGIPPEHLPRLTERFYRVDAGRSREAGGTGLGLSIVKHIVERHRGRFDITSRPGEGTTASIILHQVLDCPVLD